MMHSVAVVSYVNLIIYKPTKLYLHKYSLEDIPLYDHITINPNIIIHGSASRSMRFEINTKLCSSLIAQLLSSIA